MALAAELYRKTGLSIIVTGGQVYADSGNEAHIAKRELMLLGVPEEKILIEDQSLNTRQNALYTGEIIRDHGWNRPILVTVPVFSVIGMNSSGDIKPYFSL